MYQRSYWDDIWERNWADFRCCVIKLKMRYSNSIFPWWSGRVVSFLTREFWISVGVMRLLWCKSKETYPIIIDGNVEACFFFWIESWNVNFDSTPGTGKIFLVLKNLFCTSLSMIYFLLPFLYLTASSYGACNEFSQIFLNSCWGLGYNESLLDWMSLLPFHSYRWRSKLSLLINIVAENWTDGCLCLRSGADGTLK